VCDYCLITHAEQRTDCGAEPGQLRALDDGTNEQAVYLDELFAEKLAGLLGRVERTIKLKQLADNDMRRDISASMATHSVGNNHQESAGESGILVTLTDEPHVRRGCTVRRH
jgi:hypothetical protein